jgi:predicted choloylglycine hydrolase
VKRIAGNVAWQAHVIVSRTLLANVAPRHREEIEAFQKASGLPGNDLIASQMLYDTISSFGCSSILVPADQSAAGGPLMGRNFDYASFGLLHANDLVKVYRPDGQYAFAGVGFPGCFGVISGMNEHGLAIALHEVRRSADNSPKFNPAGVPTLFALRQVLEECRTIDEAKKLLAKLPRTTMYNLAMCDPHNGGVLEVTVDNVILRRTAGLNACTNHFRTKKLSLTKECDRFATLMQPSAEPFTVDTVFSRLQATNQGEKTFQSMVFEPSDLVLHLAIETRPSTDGTLRRIDLKPLLQPK